MAFFAEAGLVAAGIPVVSNREKIIYLKQYASLNNEINRKFEKSVHLRSKAEKITSTFSDLPHTSNGKVNKLEIVICEMMDCDKEVDKLIDELCNLKQEIKHYILLTGDTDEMLLAIVDGKIEK